jgi:CDP-diacylglycerol---glycerol-3-phosphate 3-phosphatidyltransferase
MFFTIPNIMSLFRAVIAPFVFYLLLSGEYVEFACLLYVIASLSDFFDGWIARKYDKVSNLGKFLDPLADKILTTSAFVAFIVLDIVELWMVVVIVVRDFGTTILRLYVRFNGKPMRTSVPAKIKTTLQMIFIAYVLLLLLLKEHEKITSGVFGITSQDIVSYLHSDVIYYTMLSIALLSLWTLFEYLRENFIKKS